ncbi:trafficking protein particle complex subunit 6b-like [Zophobas morio]|uniref:trafficking protein particle complex subunit 6b-like n=1 Tax=Zophobas morio TaxID=2755281 RepID=UPI003082A6D0
MSTLKTEYEVLFGLLYAEIIQVFESSNSKEQSKLKIEKLGFWVGCVVAHRISKNLTSLKLSSLEVMKILCKDFWLRLFNKQVDNLRTNHRGIFIIHESQFRPLLLLHDFFKDPDRLTELLLLHTGLIKGFLHAFNLEAAVSTELTNAPACIIQVKIPYEGSTSV